jgi:hypothetical protein
MENGGIGVTALGALAVALGAVACGGTVDDGGGGSSGNAGGGSGGSTAGAGGSGALGGTGGGSGGGGSGGTFCDDLAKKYDARLQLAKQCNPFIDMEQCTLLIASGLACGCGTFVSTSQQIAVSDLMKLKADWDAGSCGANILCAPCPPQPSAGYCEPTGSVGLCLDAE